MRPRATELSAKSDNVSFSGKIMKEREDKSSGGGGRGVGGSWWSQFGGARWKEDFIPPEERRQTRKRRHAHSPAALLRLTKVCPDFITGLGLEAATAFVSGSSQAAEDRHAWTPLEPQRQTIPGGALSLTRPQTRHMVWMWRPSPYHQQSQQCHHHPQHDVQVVREPSGPQGAQDGRQTSD